MRHPQPGIAEDAEQQDHEQAAEQAQLLADDREDEVGVRGRQQVGPFLPGRSQALAPPAARGQRVDPVNGLPAAALGVFERVPVGQQPFQPVRLDHRQDRADHPDHPEQAAVDPAGRAHHPQHDEEHREHHDRRAHVGLQHDQATDQHRHRHDRDDQVLPVAEQPVLPGQQVGRPEHQRELGQLARLQGERADADPALGAVGRHPQRREHRQEQQQGDPHERVGDPAEHPQRHPARGEQHRQTDAHPGRLPNEDRVGRAEGLERPHVRRREHHDQAEQQQQPGRRTKQVVGGQRALQQRQLRQRRALSLEVRHRAQQGTPLTGPHGGRLAPPWLPAGLVLGRAGRAGRAGGLVVLGFRPGADPGTAHGRRHRVAQVRRPSARAGRRCGPAARGHPSSHGGHGGRRASLTRRARPALPRWSAARARARVPGGSLLVAPLRARPTAGRILVAGRGARARGRPGARATGPGGGGRSGTGTLAGCRTGAGAGTAGPGTAGPSTRPGARRLAHAAASLLDSVAPGSGPRP